LLAAKIVERLSIGGRGRQGFQPLILEKAPVELIGPRLRNDIDDAARCPAKFRVRTRGNDLKLLHGIQSDVDGRALSPHLLPEESIIVVAAIEADIVGDPA